ncbi:hypothetical protein B0H17DRAFT_1180303 [Mycena rosella]|uniref:Uncharacterized protein n=1 Tax=Mycena rosella TaxID=1033263 RepID=A0AAD7DDT3_MYCRO|nr:hypothetical protein B0H17DRAFT_1180303 [Mycena rosella]
MASNSPRGVYPGVPTPIRAITTPLRSSAAPPIPPASQLYEPLAKGVLHRRLTTRIFPYTALVCVISSALWLFWIRRFSIARLLGASGALWAGGVLPVLLLRKAYLTVTRTSAASPALLVQKSFAPPLRARTHRALQAHVLSALCVLALHAALDPALPVFIKSRKHPYTPHPVLVLLALSQTALAALYVLRAVLRDVWVFPFRRPALTPAPGAFLAPLVLPLAALPLALVALFIVLPLARRVPILSFPLRPLRAPRASVLRSAGRAWALGVQTAGLWEAAAGVWGWAVGEMRSLVGLRISTAFRTLLFHPSPHRLPSFPTAAPFLPCIPLLPSSRVPASSLHPAPPRILHPLSARVSARFPPPHDALHPRARLRHLRRRDPRAPALRVLLLGVLLRLRLGVLHALIPRAPLLPRRPARPARARAPPPAAPPTIYTHLAYAELLALAAAPDADAAGRAGAFEADVWARLVREALVLLGREYQVLRARGGEAASSSASSAASAGSAASPSSPAVDSKMQHNGPPVTPLAARKENIFAPRAVASPGARVGEALASGGAVEALVVPALEGVRIPLPAGEWGWRAWGARLGLPAGIGGVGLPASIGGLAGGGMGILGRGMGMGIMGSVMGKGMGRIGKAWTVARRGREVGVLTRLTCASLAEDRLGVVQRDIPRVVEALVAFLGEVERAQGALRPAAPPSDGTGVDADGEHADGGQGEGGREEREKKEKRERREEREAEARDLEEARAVLGDVGDALKEGLARIARTFGDKLRAFRFAPRVAARMQEFVDYCV